MSRARTLIILTMAVSLAPTALAGLGLDALPALDPPLPIPIGVDAPTSTILAPQDPSLAPASQQAMAPASGATIQAAIDAAPPGASILLDDGDYQENLVIDKPLTLRSLHGPGAVRIEGRNDVGDTIHVTGDGVRIEGLTVTQDQMVYAFAAINISGSASLVLDNEVHGAAYGILLRDSSGHLVQGNNATGNAFGLFLDAVTGSSLVANDASASRYFGMPGTAILLSDSHYNLLQDNTARDSGTAVSLLASHHNEVLRTDATNSTYGAAVLLYGSDDNTLGQTRILALPENVDGIKVRDSRDDRILDNIVEGGYFGLDLSGSTGTLVVGNHLAQGRYGVWVYGAHGNILQNNLVDHNGYGIFLAGGSRHNDLIGNSASLNRYNGIQLNEGSDENRIIGNTVSGNHALPPDYFLHLDPLESGAGALVDEGSALPGTLPDPTDLPPAPDAPLPGLDPGSLACLPDCPPPSVTPPDANGFVADLQAFAAAVTALVDAPSGAALALADDATVLVVSAPFRTVETDPNSDVHGAGIALLSAGHNTVQANTASDNGLPDLQDDPREGGYGIYIGQYLRTGTTSLPAAVGADGNEVSHNVLQGNGHGLGIVNSTGNRVFLNEVVDNGRPALLVGPPATNWTTPEAVRYAFGDGTFEGRLGNHWAEILPPDTDKDGVGDEPVTLMAPDAPTAPGAPLEIADTDPRPLTSHPEAYRFLAPETPGPFLIRIVLDGPVDGSHGRSLDSLLSVYVLHDGSEPVTVTFRDGADGTVLASLEDVRSGRVQVPLTGLKEGTTRSWYVEATSPSAFVRSDTWSFTTGFLFSTLAWTSNAGAPDGLQYVPPTFERTESAAAQPAGPGDAPAPGTAAPDAAAPAALDSVAAPQGSDAVGFLVTLGVLAGVGTLAVLAVAFRWI